LTAPESRAAQKVCQSFYFDKYFQVDRQSGQMDDV
jgi:hypothetical protein